MALASLREYSCPVFLKPLRLATTVPPTLPIITPTLQTPHSPYPRPTPATFPSSQPDAAINPVSSKAQLSQPPSTSEQLLPTFGPTDTGAIRPSINYRPLLPSDYANLKAIHEALFPIKYEEDFFGHVVAGRGFVAWAAVDQACPQQVVGFVTARSVQVGEMESEDLLAYSSAHSPTLVYICTLGVTKQYRQLGIASDLICKVTEYAAGCPLCRGVYLHVISYNHSAILLYKKNSFKCLRRLPRFYVIDQAEYDAFVFVHYCNGGKPHSSSLLGAVCAVWQGIKARCSRLVGVWGSATVSAWWRSERWAQPLSFVATFRASLPQKCAEEDAKSALNV